MGWNASMPRCRQKGAQEYRCSNEIQKDSKLSAWVNTQRTDYKKKRMTELLKRLSFCGIRIRHNILPLMLVLYLLSCHWFWIDFWLIIECALIMYCLWVSYYFERDLSSLSLCWFSNLYCTGIITKNVVGVCWRQSLFEEQTLSLGHTQCTSSLQ